MPRAKQKKRVLLRRLAKRRTRYEAAPVSDALDVSLKSKRRDSKRAQPWLDVDETRLIEV